MKNVEIWLDEETVETLRDVIEVNTMNGYLIIEQVDEITYFVIKNLYKFVVKAA